MNIENRIRKRICNAFHASLAANIAEHESLVTNGYVDSAGMLQQTMHLGNAVGIVVDDAALTPRTLETTNRMAGCVRREQPPDAG